MTRNERQLKAVEQEMERFSQEAQSIWKKADEDDRDTTHEERGEVEEKLKAIDTLKERKQELESAIKVEKDTIDLGRKIGAEDETEPKKDPARPNAAPLSAGAQFVQSEAYKALKAKGLHGQWTTGQIEVKTTLLEGDNWDAETGSPAAGAPLVPIDQRAGVVATLFDPNVVASLVAQGTTSSNSVRYVIEDTATSGAASVDEGGSKPESTISFDQTDEPVRKIATSITVSDEMLEDAQQIQSYLNARLSLFVRNEENDELLNGTGSGTDLVGLLARVPGPNQDLASQADAANPADNIYQAITAIRVGGFMEPDGIVIHPEDWAFLRTVKDQNENYIAGSPFSNTGSNPGDNLWGKRVVITQAIAQGTALVGAFQEAAQIFRRGGLTVEATNSHSTNFVYDLTVIRAETRLALAVYRPNSFATADLYAS